MLDVDPPDHTRLRALVHKAFTPRLIDNLRGRIQSLTDELLNAVDRKGRMDLIRDYALPLPTTVIAEMLGVPARDRHRFHRWSSGLLSATPNALGDDQGHTQCGCRFFGTSANLSNPAANTLEMTFQARWSKPGSPAIG